MTPVQTSESAGMMLRLEWNDGHYARRDPAGLWSGRWHQHLSRALEHLEALFFADLRGLLAHATGSHPPTRGIHLGMGFASLDAECHGNMAGRRSALLRSPTGPARAGEDPSSRIDHIQGKGFTLERSARSDVGGISGSGNWSTRLCPMRVGVRGASITRMTASWRAPLARQARLSRQRPHPVTLLSRYGEASLPLLRSRRLSAGFCGAVTYSARRCTAA